MGYALFAQQKFFYIAYANFLNLELSNIMLEKQQMMTEGASITQALASAEEAIYGDLNKFLAEAGGYIPYTDASQGGGTENQGGGTENQGGKTPITSREGLNDFKTVQQASFNSYKSFLKGKQADLARRESILDMRKEQVQMKLTVANQQLDALDQAMQKAMQREVPRYTGLA